MVRSDISRIANLLIIVFIDLITQAKKQDLEDTRDQRDDFAWLVYHKIEGSHTITMSVGPTRTNVSVANSQFL